MIKYHDNDIKGISSPSDITSFVFLFHSLAVVCHHIRIHIRRILYPRHTRIQSLLCTQSYNTTTFWRWQLIIRTLSPPKLKKGSLDVDIFFTYQSSPSLSSRRSPFPTFNKTPTSFLPLASPSTISVPYIVHQNVLITTTP